MKRNLYLISVLAVVAMMWACSNRDTEALRKSVEAYNEHCPMDMGLMGELKGVEYDESSNTVVFNYLLNDELVGVSFFRGNEQSIHKQLKAEFAQDQIRELIEMAANAGASLTCRYINKSDDDAFSIELSNADLKDIVEHPITDKERYSTILESQVVFVNSACPLSVGDGMTMVSLTDDGSSMVYLYEVDEDIVNLEHLEEVSAQLKESMKSMFYDPSMTSFLQAAVGLNRNLVYRYKGDTSGKTVDITFSPQEIPVL